MNPIIEEISLNKSAFGIYKSFSEKLYSFFLDSGMDPKKLGRFSFMGIEPFLLFKSKGSDIFVDCQGWKKHFRGNPFYILKSLLARYKSDFRSGDFPFWGGAVGWFSYDLKSHLERLPDISVCDLDIPDCALGFYDCVLIFDNLDKKTYISSSGFPELGRKRLLRAKARLENLKETLSLPFHIRDMERSASRTTRNRHKGLGSTFTKEQYIDAVLRAKEYIKKGDIYQVNLSQRFHTRLTMHPFGLYSILRRINPAPFAAYLNFGDVKVLSASPERFIKVVDRNIQTRPIKGTRPRGKNMAEDSLLKKQLTKSIKDRAENLMIIDLERNDLGRICEYGSIRVSEFMICETYPTVFHLTSTIEGRLRKNKDATDVLINCFPGGSITGAPKIRSMEIIEELEPVKRAIYTGSIGYIGFNQDMDTSIVIRTFIIKDDKAYFNVGGGIVYDSDPEKEYDETLDKAKALVEAVSSSVEDREEYANSVSKR